MRSLLAGQLQVFNRLCDVGAVAVMPGKFAQVIVQLLGEEGFNPLASALMQQLTPLHQHRVVRNLLGERVLEGVLGIADRRLLVDELAQLADH